MSGHQYEVESSTTEYQAFRFGMVRDKVAMPDGGAVDRVYMDHPGAVAVVAIDDQDRVALVHQYRHPARQRLWELPAGLRDVEGEDPMVTAGRELAEETDMTAGTMEFLVDIFASPGCSNERIRIYLAGDLKPVPAAQRFSRTAEEFDLRVEWWNLSDTVNAILSGQIVNGITVAGLLAAVHKRDAVKTG